MAAANAHTSGLAADICVTAVHGRLLSASCRLPAALTRVTLLQMSQTVPGYDCNGHELGSSLAELDFSILSDYQVPSPTASLAACERSPPRLFSSPAREEDAGYGGGAPLSPPLKQEPGGAVIKQEAAQRPDGELDTPRSPLSDCGYSSQGGSPAAQPRSPPPTYHRYPASPAHGYPQQYLQPQHHPLAAAYGPPAALFQPAGAPSAPQEHLRRLRDSALQRRLAAPAPFGLDMLEASSAGQQPGWMSVLDLALEQIRQEKKNVCMLLGISPGESPDPAGAAGSAYPLTSLPPNPG